MYASCCFEGISSMDEVFGVSTRQCDQLVSAERLERNHCGIDFENIGVLGNCCSGTWRMNGNVVNYSKHNSIP